MKRDGRGRLAAGLLLGLGILIGAARAGFALSPTDCASVDLDFTDKGASKKCQDGDAGSGLWRATQQVMVVKGQGYFLYVQRIKAGYRSYVTPEEVGDFARDFSKDLFQLSPAVKSHGMVSGYDIATFNGQLRDEPHPGVDCFAFSRYGGTINAPGGFSGAPGYANGLAGGYCEKAGRGVSDATIQHILGELRAPVN
jgi:hypothetical protein